MTHVAEFGLHHDTRDIQPAVPERVVPLLIGATVEEIERELVLQTLARCDGNRTHAARLLGFSVRTLRNKIRQYAADGADVPAHSHGGTPDDG
jgi:DNA-binding NtrC family response regulator